MKLNPPKSLFPLLADRVQEHFSAEKPEEVVNRSQSLMTTATATMNIEVPLPSESALIHPRPARIPLNAYLACALTGLSGIQKSLVVHLSDVVSLVCRSVDIELYEPRKNTDPVHDSEVPDTEVFKIDRKRVVSSDLLIHLCHFPSTGSGEELSFAYDALVPIILIAHGENRVSRMITGIPSLKIDIRYSEPEELRSLLEQRLVEIRPLLEQRRLAKDEFSENVVGARVKELRLQANITPEQLAKRVGLTVEGLLNIEENIDTIANPSLTTLRLLATALKTTVAELVNPDYYETILSGIQSILNERAVSAAARFRGMSDKDQLALIRRLLTRFLYFIEEQQ
jgi:transcriptional regulator with XRE-family HTH domain